MSARRTLLVLLAAASLVACSSSSKGSSSASSSGSSSSATTTTVATSTTAAPCTDATKPGTSLQATTATGDVDGDAKPDSVTVYALGTVSAPGPWHVAVDLAAGGRRDTTISDAVSADTNQRIRVLGVGPVGDGADTVFVSVGSGASATIVGLFRTVGCDLARVNNANAAPATFTVGGSITHLDGLACENRSLRVLSASSADGESYTGTSVLAKITGATIDVPSAAPAPIPAASLQTYGTLSCPEVETP